jgi:Amt family ammonium transporter
MVVEWRTRTSIDDTLDVFPCHGVGGMVGMLLTGVFAHHNVNAGCYLKRFVFWRNSFVFGAICSFGRGIGFCVFWFIVAESYRYDIAA